MGNKDLNKNKKDDWLEKKAYPLMSVMINKATLSYRNQIDRDAIEDIVFGVFHVLCELSLERLNNIENVSFYVFTMVNNACKKYVKDVQRKKSLEHNYINAFDMFTPSKELTFDYGELAHAKAIKGADEMLKEIVFRYKLSFTESECLRLRAFLGKNGKKATYQDIADVLGLKVSYVTKVFSKIRDKISKTRSEAFIWKKRII